MGSATCRGRTWLGGTPRPTNTNGNGAVFRMDTTGVFTALHSCAGSDGVYHQTEIIQTSDGSFYGTTYQGSATNKGTVFEMNSAGVVTTLHSFQGSDGSGPTAKLILG